MSDNTLTRAEISNILNKVTTGYEVVNYGVGGYALDQSFIRYLKYQKNSFHD